MTDSARDSADSGRATYRAECKDCSWSYENDAYGAVEQKALSHSEQRKHSVPTPEEVDD